MLLEGRNGSRYGYRGPDVSFAFDTRRLHSHADVQRYAAALVRWSKGRGAVYRGNRHLAPWGSDFQFTDAGLWCAPPGSNVPVASSIPMSRPCVPGGLPVYTAGCVPWNVCPWRIQV